MVANSAGAARARRDEPESGFEVVSGRSPIVCTDPMHGVPDADGVRREQSPPNERNSYPDRGAPAGISLRRPDAAARICTSSTPRGTTGPSAAAISASTAASTPGQSRAPLILSGAGRARVRASCRGPPGSSTSARPSRTPPGRSFDGAEGEALTDLVAPGARHVFGLLWDGVNSNDLLRARSRRARCPTSPGCSSAAARCRAERSPSSRASRWSTTPARCAGSVPDATASSATSSTTAQPATRYLANDSSTWHHACDLLRPGVRTVFEVCDGLRDRERQRADRPGCRLLDVRADPASRPVRRCPQHAQRAPAAARTTRTPRRSSSPPTRTTPGRPRSTAFGLEQVVQLLGDPLRPACSCCGGTRRSPTPATTAAARTHARPGPRCATPTRASGSCSTCWNARGRFEHTTFVLTADHGSEAADPACRGDWDDALAAAGIAVRDEGYGMLYF